MHKLSFQSGKWLMRVVPHDGARVASLIYDGFELLTRAPKRFHPPRQDYGLYETRPVFGYDDCFPSVKVCRFPGQSWQAPDHGELCWLPWTTEPAPTGLQFTVQSKSLPITFRRAMLFSGNRLTWQFEVNSQASKPLPFQHVMHPLMPLTEIDLATLRLPGCNTIYDEVRRKIVGEGGDAQSTRMKVQDILRDTTPGKFRMLYLRGIKSGSFTVGFHNGMRLRVKFPRKYFNSVGIWWNNSGYPDEPEIQRCECAFEPIPGPTGSLAHAFRASEAMFVYPGQNLTWKIEWELKP